MTEKGTTSPDLSAHLQESEERFYVMAEHAPVMIWMSDSQGRCLHLNKLQRDFWGVTNENLQNFDWTTTMHPDDSAEIGRRMMAAMARRESVTIKGRYRRADGKFRVLQTDARPRFANGDFLGMIGVNVDVTERETAEAVRQQAENDRELLVSELKHRVNNTLSVVQAMAKLTFHDASRDAQAAFAERLAALSRSNDLLTQSKQGKVTFRKLAATALQIRSDKEERISLIGPDIVLERSEALALGMVLHELFTNALKYGALSNDEGRIAVQWSLAAQSEPELTLNWRESGGPVVSAPKRKGFGSVLLERSVAGELGGGAQLNFLPTGLVCSVRVGLKSITLDPQD